jgi:hypothetical protein
MSEAKCRICGSNEIFATMQIKAIIDGESYYFILHYCYSCWKNSLGQYILDQLDC